MRNISGWKSKIVDELSEYISKDAPMSPNRFCDIELSLFLLEQISPNENIENGWALLTGYSFNTPVYKSLSIEDKKRIENARFYLQFYKTSYLYKEYVNKYFDMDEKLRLYDIDESTKRLFRLKPSICTKREKIYGNTFLTCPEHKIENIKWAESGENFFSYKNREESVNIPSEWEGVKIKYKQGFKINRDTKIQSIFISFEELIETAEFMDSKLENKIYKKIIEGLKFMKTNGNKILEEENNISLDGLCNIVGMVGAGKSTLMKVIGVLAARRGLHTTIVVDSIASIMDIVETMEKFEVKAAPVLGYSNREDQIKKVTMVSGDQSFRDINQNSSYKWVSTVCPLDGLRKNYENERVFEAGKQPCTRLYSKDENKVQENFICPMYYNCPTHDAVLSLNEASIWVATPASLIHTWIPTPVNQHKMRMFEAVYRRSHIVIFDEVDRVQINFDTFFAPTHTLVDGTGSSWMNELGVKLNKSYYENGRKQRNKDDARRWYEACTNAQKSIDSMYDILNNDFEITKWVKGEYFSANRLLSKLLDELGDISGKEELRKSYEDFRKEIFGEEGIHALLNGLNSIIINSSSKIAEKQIAGWFEENNINHSEGLIGKVKLILVTTLLEETLKIIIDKWDIGEKSFNINMDEIPFFTNHLKDISSIIPESPMGNIFGFRYVMGENGAPGKLTTIRCMGVGRWILLNFPYLYYKSEEIKGPHTIMLSGTSWAPKSAGYHITIKPDIILKGGESEIKAIEKSEFFFNPCQFNGEPVFVSGKNDEERVRSLERVLRYLINPDSTMEGVSIIDREIEALSEDRRRILLLVGSYNESEIVKKYLDNNLAGLRGWKSEHIYQLIRDNEENLVDYTIQRGVVNKLAQTEAKILIAPILSIERGHNILNENNTAAIGSAFFLVRPMPVPNDMNNEILYINRWALDNIKDTSWINEMNDEKSIGTIMKYFRYKAKRTLECRLHLLNIKRGLESLEQEERENLYWTQLVVMWQVIGRLVRGGSPARVHFCDAAFAPKTAMGTGVDKRQNSILVGMKDILKDYFEETENKKELLEREIAKALYSPLYNALSNIKGVDYGGK